MWRHPEWTLNLRLPTTTKPAGHLGSGAAAGEAPPRHPGPPEKSGQKVSECGRADWDHQRVSQHSERR